VHTRALRYFHPTVIHLFARLFCHVGVEATKVFVHKSMVDPSGTFAEAGDRIAERAHITVRMAGDTLAHTTAGMSCHVILYLDTRTALHRTHHQCNATILCGCVETLALRLLSTCKDDVT
jgi:chloramphenicol 3-O-phosphotransferase